MPLIDKLKMLQDIINLDQLAEGRSTNLAGLDEAIERFALDHGIPTANPAISRLRDRLRAAHVQRFRNDPVMESLQG